MMYTRLQNYTSIVVGKHGIQILEVMVVELLLLLLSFDVFVPTSAHPLFILDKWALQIIFKVNYKSKACHLPIN